MSLTKKELVTALNTAEKAPRDRVGIASEIGICSASGVGSAAIASTVFATTSTTTTMVTAPVLGSQFLGSLLGAKVATTATVLVAAPFVTVMAIAVGGVALSYGLIKLVKNSKEQDMIREQYKQELRQKIVNYDFNADEKTKVKQIESIYQQLIKSDLLSKDSADFLLDGISKGVLDLDLAFHNASKLLDDA